MWQKQKNLKTYCGEKRCEAGRNKGTQGTDVPYTDV